MSIINKIADTVNPSSIEDLKGSIGRRSGLAKTNRFAIFMSPPTETLARIDLQRQAVNLLSGTFSLGSMFNDPRDMSLLCESCKLPGRQITTGEKQHLDFRQSVKYPTGYINEDVEFTYHLTGDYYIKEVFDRWMGTIIDQDSYNLRYKNSYVSDVVIQQLNDQNIPIYGVRLINAYPITVNAVELNNSSTNSTQKLSVTLTYEDYVVEGALASAVSGIKAAIPGRTGVPFIDRLI